MVCILFSSQLNRGPSPTASAAAWSALVEQTPADDVGDDVASSALVDLGGRPTPRHCDDARCCARLAFCRSTVHNVPRTIHSQYQQRLTLPACYAEQSLCNGRASVRQSVCLSHRSIVTTAAGGVAAERPATRRYRSCCTRGAQQQIRATSLVESRCQHGGRGHITKQSSVLFPGLSVNPPSKEMHVHYAHHRQLDYWDIKQAHGQSASSNLPHNDKLVAASVFRADIARMSIWSSLQCGTIHHL